MTIKIYSVLFTALAGIGLTACTGGPAYLPIELRAVTVIPDLRVAKTFYSSDDADAAVEIGATRMTGSDSTSRGGAVRIGNRTFPASQTVDTEFTFAAYDISARWRQFPKSVRFGYEVAGGFSYADLHLAVSSSTGPGTESVSSPAFRLAGGGMLRVRPTTHLEANATILATNSQFRNVTRLGVTLVQTLGSRATIRGGYSLWALDAPDATRSLVKLMLSGPSIGFGLNF